MKYDIKFSCGHEHQIELFGKTSDRERKIAYFENFGVCPDCYREQKNIENTIGCEEIEIPYKDYKQNYPSCRTKAGSYNGETKTIIVYVPTDNK